MGLNLQPRVCEVRQGVDLPAYGALKVLQTKELGRDAVDNTSDLNIGSTQAAAHALSLCSRRVHEEGQQLVVANVTSYLYVAKGSMMYTCSVYDRAVGRSRYSRAEDPPHYNFSILHFFGAIPRREACVELWNHDGLYEPHALLYERVSFVLREHAHTNTQWWCILFFVLRKQG